MTNGVPAGWSLDMGGKRAFRGDEKEMQIVQTRKTENLLAAVAIPCIFKRETSSNVSDVPFLRAVFPISPCSEEEADTSSLRQTDSTSAHLAICLVQGGQKENRVGER